MMLLQQYRIDMFRPKCNPSFESVHCVARLDQDISEVLPYLNTTLGGGDYAKDPPTLTLRVHGKLISLHAREIFGTPCLTTVRLTRSSHGSNGRSMKLGNIDQKLSRHSVFLSSPK